MVEVGTIVGEHGQDRQAGYHNPASLLELHRHLQQVLKRDHPLLKHRRKST